MADFVFPDAMIAEVLNQQLQEAQVQKRPVVPENNLQLGSGTGQVPNHGPDNGTRVTPCRKIQPQVPGEALWGSTLLQNYIHGCLRQNRFTEPLEIGRLAVHIGVSYENLLDYLNAMYPHRGRMLITDEF